MSDLSPERFRQADALFDAALDLPSEAHEEFLAQTTSHDPELGAHVRRLLRAYRDSGDFLERPLVVPVATRLREAWEVGSPPAPERIGPFRVVRELGRGGMGAVFLGERDDGEFEQRVALKLVPHFGGNDVVVRRFREERRILARLEHPRIARLIDGGVTGDGTPWFAMEYVDGERLDAWCDARTLPLDRRLDLFAKACEAVQYAHQQLVVHRDLKPSNILVTADGVLKLLDFGIAKLVDAGAEALATPERDPATVTLAMTPQYAAPEQVRGEPAGTATDVYALGVLLYELLTGRRPYDVRGRSPAEIEHIVCESVPPPPSASFAASDATGEDAASRARARGATPERLRRRLRGDLDAIVMRALRKEPARRYPSVDALLDDLHRVRDGRPVLARPETAGYRLRRYVGRNRTGVAAAVLLLGILGAGFARERALRRHAESETRKVRAVEQYMRSVFNVANPFARTARPGTEVTARDLLDGGVARVDRELSAAPDVQAQLRGAMASVYANLGVYDRAAEQWRRALDQRRALYGARHPDVAEAMDGLGDVLARQQRYDEGEQLLREALALQRELDRDGRPTASTLEHLATLRRERGELASADTLAREALALRRRLATTSVDSAALADAANNVALLRFLRGEYDAAEPAYREALALSIAVLGEDHPNSARIVQNLAQVQQFRGNLDEAEALYRRSLEAKRRALGDLHPSVTIGMNNFGNFLAQNRGKVEEADSLFRMALALDRQLFGDSHAYVAAGLNNRAVAARLRGRFDESARLSRDAIAIARSVYTGPHRETAAYLNGLASSLAGLGDLAGANEAFREAVEEYVGALGERHLFTQTVAVNQARILLQLGDLDGADRLFKGAIAVLDTTRASDRPVLVSANVGVGRVLTGRGRAREAVPLLERTLTASRVRPGPRDPRTADAMVALGTALNAVGEYGRSESVLVEAVAILEPNAKAQARLIDAAREALEEARRGAPR